MKTLVTDEEEDKEFFKMLSHPFTFNYMSTKGGERRIIAQGVEWPDGRVEIVYKNLATLMEHESSHLEISWHSTHDDPVTR